MAVLLGDFLFTPAPGYWLDYSRSGKLSQNRFLAVQHVGLKGQYDQGPSRFTILDQNGEILYEIAEASNAWFIANGVVGDEDTFVFQRRQETDFQLWHPQFGCRPLRNNQLPPNMLGFQMWRKHNDGRRFFLVNEYDKVDDPQATDQRYRVTEIQEIELLADSPEDLFEEEELRYHYHSRIFDTVLKVTSVREGFLLHLPKNYDHGTYFLYKLNKIQGEARMIKKSVPMPFVNLYASQGYVCYSIRVSGSEGNTTIFAKESGEEIFRRVMDGRPTSPARAVLEEFLRAFRRGVVSVENGKLTTLVRDGLLELDPAAKTLSQYPSDFELIWAQPPDSTTMVVVTHQSMRVSTINVAATRQQTPTVYQIGGTQ